MNRTLCIAVLAASLLAGACSGVEDGVQEPLETDASASEVRFRTWFEVVGGSELPGGMELESLFLNVGSLILEPMVDDSAASSQGPVAFATARPFPVHFDLAEGQRVFAGPEIVLPQDGDFSVSILVEPPAVGFSAVPVDDKVGSGGASVELLGRVGSGYEIVNDPPSEEDNPEPVPWRSIRTLDGLDLTGSREFVYRSDRVVRFHLDSVMLQAGSTWDLRLTVELDDWLNDSVIPAVDALLEVGDVTSDDSAMDITETVESETGSDELIGGIAVHAVRRR